MAISGHVHRRQASAHRSRVAPPIGAAGQRADERPSSVSDTTIDAQASAAALLSEHRIAHQATVTAAASSLPTLIRRLKLC